MPPVTVEQNYPCLLLQNKAAVENIKAGNNHVQLMTYYA